MRPSRPAAPPRAPAYRVPASRGPEPAPNIIPAVVAVTSSAASVSHVPSATASRTRSPTASASPTASPSPTPSPSGSTSDLPPVPQITRVDTYHHGAWVYFDVYYADPDQDAWGFGFMGGNGSRRAEETYPFSDPHRGIVGPDSIAYPANLECGTARQHKAEIEAWIYEPSPVSACGIPPGAAPPVEQVAGETSASVQRARTATQGDSRQTGLEHLYRVPDHPPLEKPGKALSKRHDHGWSPCGSP